MQAKAEEMPRLNAATIGGKMSVACLNECKIKTKSQETARLTGGMGKSAQLVLKEICMVSGGDLTVLSASDMVLRLRNGDYIILREDE